MNNKLDSRRSGVKIFFPIICLLLAISPIMAVRSANIVQSPERRISLNVKDKSLREILDEIKKQTGVGFSINNSVEAERIAKLSVMAANESLTAVLGRLLADTGCGYTLIGNNIVIVAVENNRPDGSRQQQPPVQIRGKVVNEDTGEPVAGVTIKLKSNPAVGTFTDAGGHFTLSVPNRDDILSISSVGMVTSEYKLPSAYKPGTVLVIPLKGQKQVMDEVIVLGVFQKPIESFTGAVTTITAKELKQYGSRDILTTIRNIDPSFNIIENNDWGSDPNKLPEITLRGTSSIPNIDELTDEARSQLNTPLIYIDGFESNLSTLHNMNQDEVAFINILKDAAATALYGSRGSNGVIIVETKPPVLGKLQLTVNYSGGIEMPDLTSYSLLNARDKLDLEFKVGKYDMLRAEHDIAIKKYYYYLLDQVNQGVDTYWLSKPLRTGIRSEVSLRAEGGDRAFRYSLSLQSKNVRGVMKGDKNNNVNAGIKLSYDYKNLRFTNHATLNVNNTVNSPWGDFSEYTQKNPYFNPYDENGNPVQVMGMDITNLDGVSQRWNGLASVISNPLYNATLDSFDKTQRLSLTDNFAMVWTIAQGLELKGNFGIMRGDMRSDVFVSPDHSKFVNYTDNNILRKGSYAISQGNEMTYSGNATLTYVRAIDKHVVQAGANYSIKESKSNMYSFQAEGFTNPEISFIGTALQYVSGGKPDGWLSHIREMGINANASYVYNMKYTLEGTARYDGSSLFGSDKRFGFFWSAGAAWTISNEPFLVDSKIIDRLRLFVNAGTTGTNRFSPYQAITSYQYYTDQRYYSWTGAQLMGIGNPGLQWEKKMQYSAGLESQFLNKRLAIRINGYYNTTNNLFSSVDIPTHAGFTSYKENVGRIRNIGYEIYLMAEIIKIPEKEISWSISPTLMHNSNKILKISQAMIDAQQVSLRVASTNPKTYYFEGSSARTIWAVQSLGIDPSTGKEMYRDRNGKTTFIYDPLDMKAVGNADPVAWGNINTYFRWKNIVLAASFGYKWGGQQYNTTLMDKVENTSYNNNVDSRVYTDRWQKPGDNVFFKSIFITSPTYVTSRFVQDENIFRCQNVSLEYSVRNIKGMDWIRNVRMSVNMADIFYVSSIKRERGTKYPFSRTITYSLSAMF